MFDFIGEATYQLMNVCFFIWNLLCQGIFKLLATSPAAFKDGAAWELMMDAKPYFVAVASPVAAMFFVWGFCSKGIDIQEDMRFETIFRLLIRLSIAEYLVVNIDTIIKALFKSGAALAKLVGSSKANKITLTEEQTEAIKGMGLEGIPVFMITIILGLIIIGCGFMLLYTVYFRFLKLIVMVPIGSLAAATMAGSDQITHSFSSFAKYTFCLVIEASVMALALLACNSILSSGSIINLGDETFLAHWTVLIFLFEATFSCVLTVGAVKGAEQLCQKAFGL